MRYNRLFKDNNYLTPTTYTQQLSEYTEKLKFEEIPPEVVERAKMIMLQTIGVTLAARNTPTTEKVMQMSTQANGGPGGPPPCGVWERKWRLSTRRWLSAPCPTRWIGRTAHGQGILRQASFRVLGLPQRKSTKVARISLRQS